MSNYTVVKVKGSLLRHASLIFLVLFFLFGAVAVIMIPGQTFVRILTGERPLDINIIYPLFVLVFIGLAVFVILQAREMWNLAVFSKNRFQTHGLILDYNQILRIHINPSEDYMVMLFKEPIGETKKPGIEMPKNRITPSIQILLDLLRDRGVEIEKDDSFSDNDLWKMRKRLWDSAEREV
jgi:hypothetical protein